ncbi:uncharacterized protein LOC141690450 [Apium graveolens]|uniref:uncharacterized protein LOC141690450 n=1 Tax=Apium graveolens TaxID=4045 RepID=UPI003D795065
MQSFKDFLVNSGLEPMCTVGDIYTPTNKRLHDPVFKHLDRMVANSTWFNSFTEGSVCFKHRGIMDHNPLLFEKPMHFQKYGKPFQFFNFMIEIPGFLDLVAYAWSMHCVGSHVAQFNARLKHTKLLLRKFNREHGNIQSNVQIAHANLEVFQASMGSTVDNINLIKERDLISNLNLALAQEESLLLQKARVKWLHLGDNNNSFSISNARLIGIEIRS